MKPTIEITCWHCKHYDAYYCRCRQSKREIMWEESHNCYCFKWASSQKSVSIALCDFERNAQKGTIEEKSSFCRVKVESEDEE